MNLTSARESDLIAYCRINTTTGFPIRIPMHSVLVARWVPCSTAGQGHLRLDEHNSSNEASAPRKITPTVMISIIPYHVHRYNIKYEDHIESTRRGSPRFVGRPRRRCPLALTTTSKTRVPSKPLQELGTRAVSDYWAVNVRKAPTAMSPHQIAIARKFRQFRAPALGPVHTSACPWK